MRHNAEYVYALPFRRDEAFRVCQTYGGRVHTLEDRFIPWTSGCQSDQQFVRREMAASSPWSRIIVGRVTILTRSAFNMMTCRLRGIPTFV